MVFRRRGGDQRADPFADLDLGSLSAGRRAEVQAALDASHRFDAIVGRTPAGAIRDRLDAMRPDVHAAVRAAFDAARRSDQKQATLADLDPAEVTQRLKDVRRRLDQARDDGRPTDDLEQMAESLDRQLGSVHRVWDAVERESQELHRLQLRLHEVVALAGAVAVDVPDTAVTGLAGVADELQSLRAALDDLSA
ncbi:MAG TPA: hypothetical protein VFU14_09200 [Acidimicrobiales bacterium]|nr:hypothetical protein [Acidimicrobiales bacterium]